jgi:hypothetical protein
LSVASPSRSARAVRCSTCSLSCAG